MNIAMVQFNELRVGQKIKHPNGTCYLIVRVKVKKDLNMVWAKWRNGVIGRFGKEVVRISPAHTRGFLRYTSRSSGARNRPTLGEADRQA